MTNPRRIHFRPCHRSLLTGSLAFLVTILSGPLLNAQSTLGTIVGTITDPSHAAVPGAWFYDMGIYKSFPIHERLNLRVGMTAINLLNHPVWDLPQTNISGSNVGTLASIPSLLNYPNERIIKFQGRLEF